MELEHRLSSLEEKVKDVRAKQNSLEEAFHVHEAIGNERWRVIFKDLERTIEISEDTEAKVDGIHKLILTIAGSLIILIVTKVVEVGLHL